MQRKQVFIASPEEIAIIKKEVKALKWGEHMQVKKVKGEVLIGLVNWLWISEAKIEALEELRAYCNALRFRLWNDTVLTDAQKAKRDGEF